MRQEPAVRAQHVVVVLAALTAERDRNEQPAAGRLHLAFDGKRARRCRLDCREQRPPLSDELVQLERERTSAVVSHERATALEQRFQR
jgi:hypothetical protein